MQIKLDLDTTPFNIDFTLRCGQVFRWQKEFNTWRGIINESLIEITQRHNNLTFDLYPTTKPTVIQRYFRLDDDLPCIIHSINKDSNIGKALTQLQGLRLIRQDPWECVISFICATFANIPRIKSMIYNLCRAFGHRITNKRYTDYLFPSPRKLASASISQLLACNLGYRARYVKAAAEHILKGKICLQHLQSMPYPEAKQELLHIEGVGQKVADCILLFSLDKLNAFPVDRWIHRILVTQYQRFLSTKHVDQRSLTPRRYKELSAFGQSYFGDYAGYAQEYLYAYHLTLPVTTGSPVP
jgi:N-glycosylase/DNA lyase